MARPTTAVVVSDVGEGKKDDLWDRVAAVPIAKVMARMLTVHSVAVGHATRWQTYSA